MAEQSRIVVATEEQFRAMIREEVEEILQQAIPQIMRKASRKEYITTSEFKELTGCSHRLQQYYREERKIPFSQEGRKIFYKMDDVERFMEERRVD
jgi:hypothetical protein